MFSFLTCSQISIGLLGISAGYSLYNYLTHKPFPESETEAKNNIMLFPLITPNYQGIMFSKRF